MSKLKINELANVADTESVPIGDVINGSARAWVNFNGTGTVAIRDSYNVSSVTDSGVGIYVLNFDTALADDNYAVVTSAKSDVTSAAVIVGERPSGNRTTTQLALEVVKTSVGVFDSTYVEVAIHGN